MEGPAYNYPAAVHLTDRSRSLAVDLLSQCDGPIDESPIPAAIDLAHDLRLVSDIAALVATRFAPLAILSEHSGLVKGLEDFAFTLEQTSEDRAPDIARQIVTTAAYDTTREHLNHTDVQTRFSTMERYFFVRVGRNLWDEMKILAQGSDITFRIFLGLLGSSNRIGSTIDDHAGLIAFRRLSPLQKVCVLCHQVQTNEELVWPSERLPRLSRERIAELAGVNQKSITQARSRAIASIRKAAGLPPTAKFKLSQK